MNARGLLGFLPAVISVTGSFAEAPGAKLAKIGWLGARSASAPTREVFHREVHSSFSSILRKVCDGLAEVSRRSLGR